MRQQPHFRQGHILDKLEMIIQCVTLAPFNMFLSSRGRSLRALAGLTGREIMSETRKLDEPVEDASMELFESNNLVTERAS